MLDTAPSNSIVHLQPSYKPLNDEFSSASTHAMLSATRRELASNGWREFNLQNVMNDTRSGMAILDKKWSSLAELAVDSVLDVLEPPSIESRLPIVEQLCRLVDPFADMSRAASGMNLVRGMLLAAADDQAAGTLFRNHLNTHFRRPLKQILAQAAAAKKIRQTYDIDFAIEILFGPLWHRVLITRAPLSEAAVTRAVTGLMDHLSV